MKKRKQASSDFTFAQLPHNRKEVFFRLLEVAFRHDSVLRLVVAIVFVAVDCP